MEAQIVVIKVGFALFLALLGVGVTVGALRRLLGPWVQHPFALLAFVAEGTLLFLLALLAIF